MKVIKRVEIKDSNETEIGTRAGILGPGLGTVPGKGSITITESADSILE